VTVKDLDRIVAGLERDLDEKDRLREASLRATRQITRLASSAIRGMHVQQEIGKDLEAIRREVYALRKLLRNHPEFWHGGTVEGALQEAAEASIVHSLLKDRALPRPDELGVTSAAYVLGLGDAIGELRRFALDRLRMEKVADAWRFVDAMEELYHALMRFDYPDAIVAVRHKQDVARSLVERTRGELAVAARSAELERKLAELSKERRRPATVPSPRGGSSRGRPAAGSSRPGGRR
jgi:translin